MMNKRTIGNSSMGVFKRQMGIYIHIPFCAKKCSYCDFLSAPADDDTIKAYIEAMLLEIKASRSEVVVPVPTIFFGGGTPSIIDPTYIERIMEAIREQYEVESEAEITIECNPGTVSLKKLLAYKDAGINRISFGLQ